VGWPAKMRRPSCLLSLKGSSILVGSMVELVIWKRGFSFGAESWARAGVRKNMRARIMVVWFIMVEYTGLRAMGALGVWVGLT